jgi:uncharacterized protein
MTTTTLSNRSSRIEVIDVLRGFTLLGIILIHMVEQYYAGMLPQIARSAQPSSIFDNIVQGFAGVFIMGKFFMIFSFLFGLSFWIQFKNAKQENSFILRFSWRLLLLFGLGLLHHLHYRGDILGIYAVLGFGLLICYRLPDRVLLILSLILIINVPSVVTRVVEALTSTGVETPFSGNGERDAEQYYNTALSGEYVAVLKANYHAFADKMSFQVFSGRVYITFGLFLLGIYAGKKKLFENLQENVPFIKRMMNLSWKVILGAVVFAAVVFGGSALLKFELPSYINWPVGGLLYDVFNACLALIYAGGIVLLFQKQKWNKRLMNFYEVGRMGLTTYLMQSAFGVLIFFGYGLGLLTQIGAAASFGLAIVIFILQIFFSKWWFRHFTFGPFEWLWRSLTYLKIQPIVRKPQLVPQVAEVISPPIS